MKRYLVRRKCKDFNQTLAKIIKRHPSIKNPIRKYHNVINYVPSVVNHNPGLSGWLVKALKPVQIVNKSFVTNAALKSGMLLGSRT